MRLLEFCETGSEGLANGKLAGRRSRPGQQRRWGGHRSLLCCKSGQSAQEAKRVARLTLGEFPRHGELCWELRLGVGAGRCDER